ncbi:MAG: Maf family nucleotide pyrophosphatase [Candidatus Omnitrophota bacterium]
MRKIILASGSKARKEILKSLGLRFKVAKSNIKEGRRLGFGCARLVKQNALAKALDVARCQKTGLVLGADTVVWDGKRLFGKPENKKDAIKMIKRLSQRPQWVYTGLALIDIDNKKKYLDYEKTKVFMQKLSNPEIRNYLKKTPVSRFAGSFDIQAKGGFFIRRIEGCFYNVVGLPVAKLYTLFKKAGIRLLILLFAFSICGCIREYNIATGREDIILYDTEKEVNMGKSISRAVEKEYKLVKDLALIERVDTIGKKLAGVCDRNDLVYYFNVLDDKEVNAFALPGGFIYVNRGLIDEIKSDDELAAVLAHEIGHVVAKHSIKKLQAMMGYSVLAILAAQASSPGLSQGVDLAFLTILTGYSREDELLADRLAVKYTRLAGYNPSVMVDFLERLKEINQKKPPGPKSYYRTHPYISYRIMMVKQQLGQPVTFDDYINKDMESR